MSGRDGSPGNDGFNGTDGMPGFNGMDGRDGKTGSPVRDLRHALAESGYQLNFYVMYTVIDWFPNKFDLALSLTF